MATLRNLHLHIAQQQARCFWFVNKRCRFNPPSPQAKNVAPAVEKCVSVYSKELPLSTQEIGEEKHIIVPGSKLNVNAYHQASQKRKENKQIKEEEKLSPSTKKQQTKSFK
ncbi:unnamed protein product [Cuscuta campestris]|uniref:Uncharacterized protein n=1 Tax=Cuscuta campestris TaxID=132261 RepID=A0A484KJ34_9ASTE|nr:unnamed protein product [Cuscuta campestris]